jgi:hypothetical protein
LNSAALQIRIHFGKLDMDTDPDPHQSEKAGTGRKQELWRLKMESWGPWKLTKEPLRVCRTVVADSSHFNKEQDGSGAVST